MQPVNSYDRFIYEFIWFMNSYMDLLPMRLGNVMVWVWVRLGFWVGLGAWVSDVQVLKSGILQPCSHGAATEPDSGPPSPSLKVSPPGRPPGTAGAGAARPVPEPRPGPGVTVPVPALVPGLRLAESDCRKGAARPESELPVRVRVGRGLRVRTCWIGVRVAGHPPGPDRRRDPAAAAAAGGVPVLSWLGQGAPSHESCKPAGEPEWPPPSRHAVSPPARPQGIGVR